MALKEAVERVHSGVFGFKYQGSCGVGYKAARLFIGLSHGRPVLLAVMAGFDDSGFVGGDDGLYPVAAAQLHQDVADVGLDGGFAEE